LNSNKKRDMKTKCSLMKEKSREKVCYKRMFGKIASQMKILKCLLQNKQVIVDKIVIKNKKSGKVPTIPESQRSKRTRSLNGSPETQGIKRKRNPTPQRIARKSCRSPSRN